jgi:hypothetical protein
LQRGDIFQKFMVRLLDHPQVKPLLSDEHFSVDGTLIEAWAKLAEGFARPSLAEWPAEGSQKSFRPKDGSDDTDAPTSAASSERTIPMPASPIRRVGSTARPPVARRNSPIWATPSWRTGTGWRSPAG